MIDNANDTKTANDPGFVGSSLFWGGRRGYGGVISKVAPGETACRRVTRKMSFLGNSDLWECADRMVKMMVPKGLGKHGQSLWKATMTGAKASEHDLALLETGCALLDRVHSCRDRLATEGLTVNGRYGQPVAHPLIEIERGAMAEFRAILKLLGLHERVPGGI
jgi:P27 family predicted phage terminase small subunit